MDVLLALSTQISTVILNKKPQPFGFCPGHIFALSFPLVPSESGFTAAPDTDWAQGVSVPTYTRSPGPPMPKSGGDIWALFSWTLLLGLHHR